MKPPQLGWPIVACVALVLGFLVAIFQFIPANMPEARTALLGAIVGAIGAIQVALVQRISEQVHRTDAKVETIAKQTNGHMTKLIEAKTQPGDVSRETSPQAWPMRGEPPMIIISRAQWGALPARPGVQTVSMSRRTEFVVHYSDGPVNQSVLSIQEWCMNGMGYLDIDYNFLVRGDTGEIYEGRGWDAVGSHCIGHNTSGLGVCVIGAGQLSAAAQASIQWLYQQATSKAGHSLAVYGHRDLWNTDCPGDNIEGWVRSGAVTRHTPRDLQLENPYMEGPDVVVVQRIVGATPDGIYGPITASLVQHWQAAHGLTADGIVGPLTRAAMGI